MATSAKKKPRPAGFKHTIDSPVQLKWPVLDTECAQKTIELLIKSLRDVNIVPQKSSLKTDTSTIQCAADDNNNGNTKKDMLVVGINAFTRCLEKGQMRAGVICLSAKPELMTQHILMLSVIKKCPVMALYELSSKLAPVLSIKSALAIGFKTLSKDVETHPFSETINHISTNAPPIDIPWLVTVGRESEDIEGPPNEKRMKLSDDNKAENYVQLKVKKMIITKKVKNKS